MAVEMSAISIPRSHIPREPAMPHVPAWPGALKRLRRSRVQRVERAITVCFGPLTVKDKMVLKGLAASLASPTEGGEDRS